MSKKYSSNDKDRILCDRFREFAQNEGREWDSALGRYVPTGDDRDPWRAREKERDRNWGVEHEDGDDWTSKSTEEVDLNTSHLPALIPIIHDFLSEILPNSPTGPTAEAFAEFFSNERELFQELWEASKIAYVSSGDNELSSAMHDNLFDRIDGVDNFYQPAGRIFRSVMNHIAPGAKASGEPGGI